METFPDYLSSINEPRVAQFIAEREWDDYVMTNHPHVLWRLSSDGKYIKKIFRFPLKNYLIEQWFYRKLRARLGKMVPKTIFFSGTRALSTFYDDKFGDRFNDNSKAEGLLHINMRIGAIMRYIPSKLLIWEVLPDLNPDITESIRNRYSQVHYDMPSLCREDRLEICRQILAFIDGSLAVAGETGIVTDLGNDNLRFIYVDGRWETRYIDSFKLESGIGYTIVNELRTNSGKLSMKTRRRLVKLYPECKGSSTNDLIRGVLKDTSSIQLIGQIQEEISYIFPELYPIIPASAL